MIQRQHELDVLRTLLRRNLRLDHLDVLHVGDRTFALDERIRAVALERLLDDAEPLALRIAMSHRLGAAAGPLRKDSRRG